MVLGHMSDSTSRNIISVLFDIQPMVLQLPIKLVQKVDYTVSRGIRPE